MPQDKRINVRIASKVDSKDRLTEFNPKLLDKEVVYERETGKYKIGNGIDHWNELPYYSVGNEGATKEYVDNLFNSIVNGEEVYF